MIICIPVTEDKAAKSPVHAHFGSAPIYLVVDTNTLACRPLPNKHQHHIVGGCRPFDSLQGEGIDAVAVRAIGPGAHAKLKAAGIEVLKTPHQTVDETVKDYLAGGLKPAKPQKGCAQHRHQSGHHKQRYGRFVKLPASTHGCGGHSHDEHCQESQEED